VLGWFSAGPWVFHSAVIEWMKHMSSGEIGEVGEQVA